MNQLFINYPLALSRQGAAKHTLCHPFEIVPPTVIVAMDSTAARNHFGVPPHCRRIVSVDQQGIGTDLVRGEGDGIGLRDQGLTADANDRRIETDPRANYATRVPGLGNSASILRSRSTGFFLSATLSRSPGFGPVTTLHTWRSQHTAYTLRVNALQKDLELILK